MADSFTNRLIHEKSPYLLQHAHNPVDWYPWGPEAFEEAKSQDKPIFLSIGYATCHWCHVMERECFENVEIAKLLNEAFINIKVDREELPQVDSLYMEFAQAMMSGAGGWPLNVLLTPDLKPFIAVTYLPPKAQHGLMGLDEFIQQISQLWKGEEREQLIHQADHLLQVYKQSMSVSGDELPDEEVLLDGVEAIFDLADPVNGGMRGEPKFPLGYQLEFFLQFSKAQAESRGLFYVETTLDHMYRGGIYDHLGGGFSRYAVDGAWMVPHFEKTCYDNAILAKAYLQGWKLTKNPLYRRVVEETFSFILRELGAKEGGFCSGLDADTEGKEGRYYTWTVSEIREVLKEDAEPFCAFYGVTSAGNLEGRNVLHIPVSLEEFLRDTGAKAEELEPFFQSCRLKLLQKRETRPAPFKDDKILAGWNGLMIDALAQAGAAFQNGQYTSAALAAAQFIKKALWKEGRLLRRYRDGEARFPAVLEDYAFLIKGVLTLFETGQGEEWLEWAIEMADLLKRDFKAPKGAFFQTDKRDDLILRKCDFYDGAEPSGNGVHVENLLRLFQITHEEKYLDQSEDVFKAGKHLMETYPPGACYQLMALQRYLDLKSPTVIIALDEKGSLAREIGEKWGAHFCPHAVTIWKEGEKLGKLLPEEADKTPIEGKTALYICRRNACEAPLTEQKEIFRALDGL